MDFIQGLIECFEQVWLTKIKIPHGIYISRHSTYSLRDLLIPLSRGTSYNALTLRRMIESDNFEGYVPYLVLFAYKDWYFESSHPKCSYVMPVFMRYMIPGYHAIELNTFLCDVYINPIKGYPYHFNVIFGKESNPSLFFPRHVIRRESDDSMLWDVVAIIESRNPLKLVDPVKDASVIEDIVQYSIKRDKRYRDPAEKFLISKYMSGHASEYWLEYLNNTDLLIKAALVVMGTTTTNKDEIRAITRALPEFKDYNLELEKELCLIMLSELTGRCLGEMVWDTPDKRDTKAAHSLLNKVIGLGLYDLHRSLINCIRMVLC